MHRDGLLLRGLLDTENLRTASLAGWALWLLGLFVIVSTIYRHDQAFRPSGGPASIPLWILGNLLCFSLLLMLQLVIESLIIFWDKPVYSTAQLASAGLGPWIAAHLLIGGGVLALMAGYPIGKKDSLEKGFFIFVGSLPMSILTTGLIFLGALWWPSLFKMGVLTSAVIGSQTILLWILSIPLGLLAIWVILAPLKWATD